MAKSDKSGDKPDVVKNDGSDAEAAKDVKDPSAPEDTASDEGALSEKVADAHVSPDEEDHDDTDAQSTDTPMESPYLAMDRVDDPDASVNAEEEDTSEESSEHAADAETKSADEEEAAPDAINDSRDKAEADEDADLVEEEPDADAAQDEKDPVTAAELMAVGAAAGASAGALRSEDDTSRPEETAEPQAKTAPRQETRAAPSPAPAQKKGSVFPMVLGGALVAVLGFLAGRGEVLDPYLPDSLKGAAVDLAPLQEELAAQQAALDEQAAALDAQAAALEQGTSSLQEQIAALESAVKDAASGTLEAPAGLETVSEDLAALTARIDALEARPVAEAPDMENLATSDDVASLQQALQAQETELDALAERARLAEENATAEAQKVLARAALMRMSTAVEGGGGFDQELSALEEVTPVEVPQALRTAASEGVASLAELQADFAPAARAALAAARAEVPESAAEGLGGFLRRQLSVRSVVPREGDDPDAVLSRAEAAVRGGALGEALTELEALPEGARAAMQEWIDRAATRQAVQEAAASLANSLTSN